MPSFKLPGLIVVILAAFLLIACENLFNPDDDNQNGGDPNAPELTELSGPYLGQEPPGLDPVRFVPPVIAANDYWFYHGAVVFSPDGQEMLCSRYTRSDPHKISIYRTYIYNDYWTEPEELFQGSADSNCPVYSETGDTLFVKRDMDGLKFYMYTKVDGSWSQGTRISVPGGETSTAGWQFSIARNGNLYFERWTGEADDLFVSSYADGEYAAAVMLDTLINTPHSEIAPCIAPDEQYLIFSSNRPGGYGFHDLYICFARPGGGWTEPLNMGSRINSDNEDAAAVISPDGQYLFFITGRAGDVGYNPYWVDTAFIDSLRAEVSLD